MAKGFFESKKMPDPLEQEFAQARLVPKYVKEMGLSDDFETAMTRDHFFIRHTPCGSIIRIHADFTRPNIVQSKVGEHLTHCAAKE